MDLNPNNLYQHYCNKIINKTTYLNSLLILIENSTEANSRIEAINQLKKLGVKSNNIYEIMENLLLSDSDAKVRNAAADHIGALFFEKSFRVLNWAIKHERSYECVITMINTLKKMLSNESKGLLKSEVLKIRKQNINLNEKQYIFKKYKKGIKKLLKLKKFNDLSIEHLSEILINYKTVIYLAFKFPNFYYELEKTTGLVSEIDLSDYLQYEVKGTPWGWKNNISSNSSFKEIKNLKELKKIDLSNNLIKDLEFLSGFNKLETLILVNNKISDLKNFHYIEQLPNLKLVDLRGNEIVNKLNKTQISSKVRIIKHNYV